MAGYFAYIRVSTQKQCEAGSSLTEQRDAITAFAGRNELPILQWYEETETAAKQGRGQFSIMMKALRSRRAAGVIFHKIDRGARNLRDWNAIQELTELGLDVRFAHESLDMQTRGGRLTADLLAVIASDYIRNLRDEVRKGIRGRLKQGLYPLQAPIGYLDAGGGKPKQPDPVRAPLIRQAFELYATGLFGIHSLVREMHDRGLRTRAGGIVGVSNMAAILRRKFYMGLIEMNGAVYQGVHPPIVKATLFRRVQDTLDGKLSARPQKHDFLYRRMLRCATCERALIGERQKGHTYYRCHARACTGNSLREENITEGLIVLFRRMQLSETEANALQTEASVLGANWKTEADRQAEANKLTMRNLETRLSRLTDAYLDGVVDKASFETKKAEILEARSMAAQGKEALEPDVMMSRVQNFLELAKSLCSSYQMASPAEKREIVQMTMSNLSVNRKSPSFKPRSPFLELANRHAFQFSALTPDRPRTGKLPRRLKKLFDLIIAHVAAEARKDEGREAA
jgi:DNA invertase Pin-like site-specific DNA recombinase